MQPSRPLFRSPGLILVQQLKLFVDSRTESIEINRILGLQLFDERALPGQQELLDLIQSRGQLLHRHGLGRHIVATAHAVGNVDGNDDFRMRFGLFPGLPGRQKEDCAQNQVDRARMKPRSVAQAIPTERLSRRYMAMT